MKDPTQNELFPLQPRFLIRLLVDVCLLLLLGYCIYDRFDLSLLVKDTILTGGDSASWYQVALHLKQELLPNGRLFGWDQQNFFGYPNFQYYFIPPFLLAALLGYILPLTISLKIVTVLGLFGTPYATYWALGKMKYPHPLPAAGAWASLVFIFHERFNMFGGNTLSTFAGEFTYSFAFLLLILFMGSLHNGVADNKKVILNAVLLATLGLSHAFVFLVAVFMPVYFLWATDNCRITGSYLIKLYVLAFLLMAFWVFPMLSQIEYTTPIRMIWNFADWQDFLHSIHYEILIIAILAVVCLRLAKRKGPHQTFYIYMMLVSVMLYGIATLLKIPDIRFLPPLLFFSILLILDSLHFVVKSSYKLRVFSSISVVMLAILIGGSWMYAPTMQAPGWFRWNYSGYEHKPAFNDGTMAELSRLLSSESTNIPSARVAWEKAAPYNNDFGSDRVFENLSLFAGRSATEGIHYSSALLSKPITWMHGEHSLSSASPEALIYAHYNLSVIPDRFNLFNISELITRSPEITELVAQSGYFDTVGKAGKLTVFSLRSDSGGYISTPSNAPMLANLQADNWKDMYYAWFQHPDNLRFPIVSKHLIKNQRDLALFPPDEALLNNRGRITTHEPRPIQSAVISDVRLSNQEIQFRTDTPRISHIIKVAYSPNWKSVNGESIFPVSPGLMLIYPESTSVTLNYQRGWGEYMGGMLTLTGLVLALVPLLLSYWRGSQVEPRFIDWMAYSLCKIKTLLVMIIGAVLLTGVGYSLQLKQQIKGDYQTGNLLMQQGDKAGAERAYLLASSDERMARYPQNPDIPHALNALAWLYVSQGKDDAALAAYRRILSFNAYWIFIHQVYQGIGQIHERSGDMEKAADYFGRCAQIDHYSSVGHACRKKAVEMTKKQ